VPRAPSALCIEPSDESAAGLEAALRAQGVTVRRAADAETGWRLFTQSPPDAIFTALKTPKRDAAWLLRRMQEDYLGSLPPVYALVSPEEIARLKGRLELDAAVLRPGPTVGLAALVGPTPEEPPAALAGRLADLFDLSLLAGDLESGVRVLVERTARAFRVEECRLVRTDVADEADPLDVACGQAVVLGTTLISGGAVPRSIVAAPLDVPGGGSLGCLALVAAGTRRFLAEERHTLRALARRVGLELAWRSAHDRLAIEHDRMRASSFLDPLLGVLTRGAFEEAVAAEIARAAGADEPLVLAVLDVVQLRQINDRLGHEAGDSALAQVADLVRSELGPRDIVGRVGGDELGILLANIAARDAGTALETLARGIGASRLFHLDVELPVKARIGFTAVASDHGPAAPLIRALAALERARMTGAQVHYVAPAEPPDSLPPVAVAATVDGGDSLAAGTTLGGMYQILHEISRGAMGVVYRAEDLGLRRPVAVKVLRPTYARQTEVVARFRNEAAMLASVRHENLVQVYSFGAQEEGVFFVMELVEGESLAELLARLDESGAAVPLPLIDQVVGQVAGALDVLHRAGAVHRDVKPANIVLDRARDRAVLVDVGVARREESVAEAAGTPGFGAPESFMKGDEGPGTDVYGLAATTYMLLTNLAPFGGGDVHKVVRRQLAETPAPPSLLRPGLPAAVDQALLRALSPNLRDRQSSALELAQELGLALRSGADPAAESPAPSGDTTRGALFRIAYRILGNRLGSAWVRAACEQIAGLAAVLRPTLPPNGWYPAARLADLLGQVPPGVRDPYRVAREIGRATMTATFARVYGVEPSALAALGPAKVLADTGRFWPWFHRWGNVRAEAEPTRATVTIDGTPRAPLLCWHVEGMLERVAELAGGAGARAKQTSCEGQGAAACIFELAWAESGPPP